MVKCFNCDNLMRKYSGKPVHEKLFETENYACKVKDLTLSFGEIKRERECDLFKESKRWAKI